MAATIRLIKFGGPWCPACIAMDKARTLEQLAATAPDLELQKHECPEDAEDPVADAYEAQSMPTLVFEEIATGKELLRFEGGLPLTRLRELYMDARALLAGVTVSGKNKRQAKLAASFEPRPGGYPEVVKQAELNAENQPASESDDEN